MIRTKNILLYFSFACLCVFPKLLCSKPSRAGSGFYLTPSLIHRTEIPPIKAIREDFFGRLNQLQNFGFDEEFIWVELKNGLPYMNIQLSQFKSQDLQRIGVAMKQVASAYGLKGPFLDLDSLLDRTTNVKASSSMDAFLIDNSILMEVPFSNIPVLSFPHIFSSPSLLNKLNKFGNFVGINISVVSTNTMFNLRYFSKHLSNKDCEKALSDS